LIWIKGGTDCTVAVKKSAGELAGGDAKPPIGITARYPALAFDYSFNTQAARQRRQVLQQIELAFFP
jgi:hypothetical protein